MTTVGNWVGQYTNTSGQGDIIFSGVIPGYTSFDSIAGDGVEYWYAIFDGDNREAGIGTYSGNIFTRDTILSTLVNGQYFGSAAAPLDLSGSANVFSTFNKTAFDQLFAHLADLTIHFPDAPADGFTYGRKNNMWAIAGEGGGGPGGYTPPTVKFVPDENYTLLEEDNNTVLVFTSDNPVSVVISDNLTTPYNAGGSEVFLSFAYQGGLGQVTVSGAIGVDVQASQSLKTANQYSALTLSNIAIDTWRILGDQETAVSAGTDDHTELLNRDSSDQHPISAITGLQDALNGAVQGSRVLIGSPIIDPVGGVYTFDNIPQLYNNLIVEGVIRSTQSGGGVSGGAQIFFNDSLTADQYHFQNFQARNGSVTNNEGTGANTGALPSDGFPTPATYYASVRMEVMNYTSSYNKAATVTVISPRDNDNISVGFVGVFSKLVSEPVTKIVVEETNPPAELVGELRLYGQR